MTEPDSRDTRLSMRVLAAAVAAAALVLLACGQSEPPQDPAASPSPNGTAQSTTEALPTVPKEEAEALEAMLRHPDIQSFAVQGSVNAGGHQWDIPGTLFAADYAKGKPSLHSCSAYRITDGLLSIDGPNPTVMMGSQQSLDQSAGDYVSFAFDGEIMTGGAYHHATGEEWAWSVRSVDVIVLPILDRFVAIHIYWSGDAGENFTAARSSVEGWTICWVALRGVVEDLVKAAEVASDPTKWDTRPPPPAQQPNSTEIINFGDSASEHRLYPADAYDDIVDHYRDHYGREPDDSVKYSEKYVNWRTNADSEGRSEAMTQVWMESDGGVPQVYVLSSWQAP